MRIRGTGHGGQRIATLVCVPERLHFALLLLLNVVSTLKLFLAFLKLRPQL